MTHDPISIAAAIIELAEIGGATISSSDLHRAIYFANGIHLLTTKLPLVSGCFEAWKFGPVHPLVFNKFGGSNTEAPLFKNTKRWRNRNKRPASSFLERHTAAILNAVIIQHSNMGPGQSQLLCRARGAPWHHVVSLAMSRKTVSVRINNTIYRDRFRNHKLDASQFNSDFEILDDVPFTFDELFGDDRIDKQY